MIGGSGRVGRVVFGRMRRRFEMFQGRGRGGRCRRDGFRRGDMHDVVGRGAGGFGGG